MKDENKKKKQINDSDLHHCCYCMQMLCMMFKQQRSVDRTTYIYITLHYIALHYREYEHFPLQPASSTLPYLSIVQFNHHHVDYLNFSFSSTA